MLTSLIWWHVNHGRYPREKGTVMNLGPYLKAVGGFVLSVVSNVAFRLVNEQDAIPALNDGKGWALFLVTTVVTTAGVYGLPAPGYVRPKADHTAVVYGPETPIPPIELPLEGPVPEVVVGRQTDGGKHRADDVATETGTVGPAGEATKRPRRRLF